MKSVTLQVEVEVVSTMSGEAYWAPRTVTVELTSKQIAWLGRNTGALTGHYAIRGAADASSESVRTAIDSLIRETRASKSFLAAERAGDRS